nr:MAG TPA_asm: hypothetical protein [Bacteriophage sp.]
MIYGQKPKYRNNGCSCSQVTYTGERFNDYPLAGNRNRSTAQIKAWVKIP